MSRSFARASPARIDYTNVGNVPWPWGTLAAVARIATNMSSGNYAPLLDVNAASDDAFGIFSDGDNAGNFSLYNGTGGTTQSGSQAIAIADGWFLGAVTKATGSATPRFHRYRWSANDWSHVNGGSNAADPALTATQIRVGADHSLQGSNSWDGQIVAVMFIPQYVMADGEVERLPAGRWDRWVDSGKPGFLVEYPGGRDNPILGGSRDQSRTRTREVTLAATTRGTNSDPPGFRFSRLARRR